jgi:predicted nucleotide-binding protein
MHEPTMNDTRPTVFIGSSKEGLAIAEAVQVNLDYACEAAIWSQGVFGLGDGTLEALLDRKDTFDFAVLALTADDLTYSRDESHPSPRDNVLLEVNGQANCASTITFAG